MKKFFAFALAVVMLLALIPTAAFAGESGSFTAVYAVNENRGFYCETEGFVMQLDIANLQTAVISCNGYSESTGITGTEKSFGLTYRGNVLTGSLLNGCVTLCGVIDGSYYTILLVRSEYDNARKSSSSGNVQPAAGFSSVVSGAAAQGVSIPSDFSPAYPEGLFVSFYSTDRDNAVRGKSEPHNNSGTTLTWIKYPFNAYYYGTYNGWSLIRTTNGSYYFILASICGYDVISGNSATARRGEGIMTRIKSTGITIPDDFNFSDVSVGELRNESGSEYYAIYKFADPYHTKKGENYGVIEFYCSANKSTWSKEGKVTIYGYYNGRALYQTKAGEFFWGTVTDYFKAA